MRSRALAGIVVVVLVVTQVLAAGLVPAIAADTGSVTFAFTDHEPGLGDETYLPVDATPPLWTNDLNPNVAFTAVTPTLTAGFVYTVDRLLGTVPVLPTPGSHMAYAPVPGAAPLANATLDMRGWLAQQTALYSMPGMRDPVEGAWRVHARTVAATITPPYGAPSEFVFGLDITPPRAVTHLQFVDASRTVVPFSRRDVVWDNGTYLGTPYDELSGDTRFALYLNGALLRTTRLVKTAPFMAASFEDLAPGKSTIGVAAMDAAGNEGPITNIVTFSDPDTPTISIVTPKAGQSVPRRFLVSVNTTDLGGVQEVRYEVDGAFIGKSVRAPYSLTADLDGFAQGRHTLKAIVTDMIGRTAEATSPFVLDAAAPRFASASVSPINVYPIVKDGYLDYTTMRFFVSERANIKFEVRNAKNQLVYRTTSVRNRGWNSFRWSGQGADVAPTVAKYYLRVVGTDVVGNSSVSGRYYVTVRNYSIKKVASNQAKVLPK